MSKKPRVLMSATRNRFKLESCYEQHLQDCWQLSHFHEADFVASSRVQQIVRRIWTKSGLQKVNEEFLRLVAVHQPDIAWIFKGAFLFPETLKKIQSTGVFTVNYNADHPFEFASEGSGNQRIAASIPNYDLHLTYSHRIQSQMSAQFPDLPIEVVPFGHDVNDESFRQIRKEEPPEINRVCFVGNPDLKRSNLIKDLVSASIPVDVFGAKWNRYLKSHEQLRIHGQANGEALYRTIRRYRVQLNILRSHNLDSHNMRSFEIPACGGIMLAEDSIEHRDFFAGGDEAFFFQSANTLIDMAETLLRERPEKIDAVRRAARERCRISGYSYEDRAEAAAKFIEHQYAVWASSRLSQNSSNGYR